MINLICKIFGHKFFCVFAERKENSMYVELWCLRCSKFSWVEDGYDWSKTRIVKNK